MELTEQEIRKLEKSTAEAHFSLSLGLFATALLVDDLWQILSFIILGAAFVLSSINLAFLHRWKRKKFLEIASTVQIKHVLRFLGLAVLGISLIKTGGMILVILGGICAGLGYAILIVGILKEGKKVRSKGRRIQEAKVGNNIQKQEGYSQEDIYRKLESIEKKVDSSNRTQKRIALYALGAAFVILGFSYWPGLLEHIGMDTARFYFINPVALIVLGFITMILAYVIGRQRS